MGMGSAAAPSSAQSPSGPVWWVVCLCAQWCGACREYRATFDALARAWPQVRFEWVDVEDEEDTVGDVEVETFPSILIADGQVARFLGPVLPQAQVLGRMLQGMQGDPSAPAANAQAQALFQRVAASR
ncbi:MAG: thioredoxin family protein [Proteobacteria bacterium]|nr:thioredoxin family protein [Pseudomonadota bacterium]